MKKMILGLVSLLLLAGCAAGQGQGFRRISMNEAKKLMEQPGYVLLDVRTEEEFLTGYIPGAINIPNETIGDGDIPWLKDKDQLILVYCRSGNRSVEASKKLVKLGYTNVVEIGGIQQWDGRIDTPCVR